MVEFVDKSCGYNPTRAGTLPTSFPSCLTGFLVGLTTESFTFSSRSSTSTCISQKSEVPMSAPMDSMNASGLGCKVIFIKAFLVSPFEVTSVVPQMSLVRVHFPIPFRPILAEWTFTPLFSVFLADSSTCFMKYDSEGTYPGRTRGINMNSIVPHSMPTDFTMGPSEG